jgi:hypothetical protein
MSENEIRCTSEKVLTYYKNHPTVSFEKMCELMVDQLTLIEEQIDSSLDASLASQLIDSMKALQKQVTHIADSSSVSQTALVNQLSLKCIELQRETIDELRQAMSNVAIDRITPIIQSQTTAMLDKTTILLNDLIPHCQEPVLREVQGILQNLRLTVKDDLSQLCSNAVDKETLNTFVGSIDFRLANSLTQAQTAIGNQVTSVERRLDHKLTELRDISIGSQATQQAVTELLKKMDNSSSKGAVSESMLNSVLQQLYPTGEITSVGTIKETGDIILSRIGKPTILIENKNYGRNVPQDEVKKFMRDTDIQNMCGLFLSQHTGIATKENFEIDVQNGNVLLYVHNVNYDPEKIRIAIDVIDFLKLRLDEASDGTTSTAVSIDRETLERINEEFQAFTTMKLAMIKNIRDSSEKLVKQLDGFSFDGLAGFLQTKFASSTAKAVSCEFCGFLPKNGSLSALTTHKRHCKVAKQTSELSTNPIGNSKVSGGI